MTEPFHDLTLKGFVKTMTLLTLIGWAGEKCNNFFSKPDTRPYAESTPEIKAVKSIYSGNREDGVYLTLEESWNKRDNLRQICFYDYGFNNNLDEVTISQEGRRDMVVTNKAELTKWQPLFEELKEKRFGEYDPSRYH